jgi:PAS domain S-box-containing protein
VNLRNPILSYGIAVLSVGAAIALRLLMDPLVGDRLPFVTMFVAVAFAAWFGGKGPGLAALALGSVGVAYFICEPRHSFVISEPAYQAGLIFYAGLSILFIWMFDSLQRSNRQSEERSSLLSATFAGIGDGVITTDELGRVTRMNAIAEGLTGWKLEVAQGKPMDEVFNIVNEETREPGSNPAMRALREGTVVGLANHTILISRDGTERAIDDSAAPIRDEKGNIVGAVLVFRDVDAQRTVVRRQEQALLTLERLVTSAPMGIAIFDKEMRYQQINGPLAEMNGLSPEEHIGRTVREVVPNIIDQVEPLFRQVLVGGQPLPDQVIVGETPKRPGEKREWRESWFPIADSDGTTTGVGVVVQEITEQRRVERQLAELGQRISSLMDNTPLAVVEWDANFVVTRWSGHAENVFGWSAEEVVGKRIDAFPIVFEEDRAKVEETISKLLDPDVRFVISRNRNNTKSGAVLSAEWYNSVLHDESGRMVSVLSLVLDVTERVKAEEALRSSERELAFELDSTRKLHELSIRSIASGQDQELYDQMLEAATGIMHSDFASMQIAEPIPGDDSDGVVLRLLASKGFHPLSEKFWEKVELGSDSACGQASQRGERHIIQDAYNLESLRGTRDLEEYQRSGICAMQSTPLFSRSGNLLGVISTHWRTPYSPSQRELQTFDILARQVADMIERKQTDAALRESDRRKDEFLATLAHELRNPLAPVTNSLELMKSAKDNEELVEHARSIMERQVAQMVRLIDDLLDVSRIVRDKLELKTEQVDLATVIKQAVETVKPLAERAKHNLEVRLPETPIYLEADPARLAQVFGNLLTNSCKYTESGGHITLIAERQGSDVVVSVKDDGVGIPPEMLPIVFDLFTQVDRSLERTGGGLGIGLSLVKRLVEMHGGSVVAHSDGAGRGAEFVVRLPIFVEAPPIAASQPVEPKTNESTRRILIVDDNRDNAETLARLLAISGHETSTANDGLEALRLAEQFQPEVILLDIGLPEMNGYDVCQKIRSQPWGRDIVIIALTGWGQDEDRRKSKDAGFNGHMVKPAELSKLERLIASLLPTDGASRDRNDLIER